MAYTATEIGATEAALFAANKPLLIGRNWLRDSAVTCKWNTAGTAAAASTPDSSGPVAYGFDDQDYLQTYPNSSQTTWYWVVDYGSAAMEFDSIILLNHSNLNGVTVTVQINTDDNDTWTDAVSIAETTVATTGGRVVFLSMQEALAGARKRISTCRYLRIKFAKGSGFIPKVGEFIVGRCRQLKVKPDLPYDNNNLQSDVSTTKSISGVINTYVFNKGMRRLKASLTAHETSYISDLTTFYESETDYGTLPFIWVDDPTTTPGAATWFQLERPELSMPVQGFSLRKWDLLAYEKGPNFYSQE